MLTWRVLGVMSVGMGLAAVAQTSVPVKAPSVDVATIKPSSPEERGRAIGWEGRHFTAHYTTISQFAQFAYGLQERQIVGAPRWFDTETFDIDVQADRGELSVAEWKVVLQQLLVDRFRMSYHKEQKVMPAYILTVAKGGPKLQRSKDDPALPRSVRIQRGPHQLLRVMGNRGSMAALAAELQRVEMDRPVVDQTGLRGEFNFTLTATSLKPFFAGETPDPSENAPPGLFTAIQEQLGLKLEPAKASVDCLVLDRVERSSIIRRLVPVVRLLVDESCERFEGFYGGFGLRSGMTGDDYAIGFEVSDAVVRRVAREDRLAQHREMAAGVFGEVAGDGVVVVDHKRVGRFALRTVDGVFEPAVERGWRKWSDRVGPGANGGNDHKTVNRA